MVTVSGTDFVTIFVTVRGEHLQRSGFVLMRRPPAGPLSVLGRGGRRGPTPSLASTRRRRHRKKPRRRLDRGWKGMEECGKRARAHRVVASGTGSPGVVTGREKHDFTGPSKECGSCAPAPVAASPLPKRQAPSPAPCHRAPARARPQTSRCGSRSSSRGSSPALGPGSGQTHEIGEIGQATYNGMFSWKMRDLPSHRRRLVGLISLTILNL
jgi:hypothetical protein